ncbi:E3 SUMO-protein ligase ZBED1 [Pleuronectes platessa]|uniref:E3 SUMO-protein ligase ZBED1 n=1 Tax=Pleuronectes platessa TaxID=8262 RepID=UPI00232A67B9|nr:E3 SUMO-protein ligase ZBED1 [Pleuronectes platessa]
MNKNHFIYTRHVFTPSMRTFDLSDGALDTCAMHSHHLANQMKQQLAVGAGSVPGSYVPPGPMCSGATLKLIGVNFVATARLCNTMAEKGENSEENVVDEDLVVKKNCTSAIWSYFGFRSDDVLQTQVLCKTCRTAVATSRGNTTNLHHHLQHNHKELHEQFKASQTTKPKTLSSSKSKTLQQSISQSFACVTPYEKTSKRHGEITEAITRYLAKDMMPINTVTKDGFVSLIRKLDRRYSIPSRNYFSQVAIPKMYDTCRKTVESELGQIEHYACTTDLWSSRTTEPYISLTVHFLDQDFELKTRCLQTAYFPGEHTGENIACGLREALTSWNLREEQLACITTDNGSNVVKATELNHWVRLQCFGHRLHLAIENAVKDDSRIARAAGLCKKLVGHFSHSWKQKMALKEAQQEHNLPEHSLITECPTRWGSRQKMMERILEQRQAISNVLSADRKTRHLVPSWQDLDVLESVNLALHPLQVFTDALSGESYVSVSYVKPVLHLLNTSVLAEKEDDTNLTKTIKVKILDYMNTKYDDPATQELLDTASFMDPRFKVSYISSERVQDIKTRVMSEMKETARKEGTPSDNTEAQSMDPPSNKKAKRSLGSLLKTSPGPTTPTASSMQLEQALEAELNSYLLSPTIDSEADPLAWWKLHQVTYSKLSKLARRYLCIAATSSPSERLFSTSGNVVTCQRACLKPSKVNMLVFLAKNLP